MPGNCCVTCIGSKQGTVNKAVSLSANETLDLISTGSGCMVVIELSVEHSTLYM